MYIARERMQNHVEWGLMMSIGCIEEVVTVSFVIKV
jgi:hypothetical protein